MRRYRYSSSRGGWRKYMPFVYLFSAWNVFGYVVYHTMMKKKKEEVPDYKKLTSAQKTLLAYGYNTDKAVTKYTVNITQPSRSNVQHVTGKEIINPQQKDTECS